MWDLSVEILDEKPTVKVSSPGAELNVSFRPQELEALLALDDAAWLSRGSIRSGECLGHPVWWSCVEQSVSVLVGTDDELWQVGLSDLPLKAVLQVIAEAAALIRG